MKTLNRSSGFWLMLTAMTFLITCCPNGSTAGDSDGSGKKSGNLENGALKKTGQNKSYNAKGYEDGSVKDDGHYQKGVDPSYTRDDSKDVVIDHITNFMWQDNIDARKIKKQWLSDAGYDACRGDPHRNDTNNSICYDTSGDTAATYCEKLVLGGYSDWRLPTRNELSNIMDFGKKNPAMDTTFKNVSRNPYWSSNIYVGDRVYAWKVNSYYGGSFFSRSDIEYYVRCVRHMK